MQMVPLRAPTPPASGLLLSFIVLLTTFKSFAILRSHHLPRKSHSRGKPVLRISHCSSLRVSRVVAICSLLFASAASLIAQRTVVQDAGAGKKLELHYNAANQV